MVALQDCIMEEKSTLYDVLDTVTQCTQRWEDRKNKPYRAVGTRSCSKE